MQAKGLEEQITCIYSEDRFGQDQVSKNLAIENGSNSADMVLRLGVEKEDVQQDENIENIIRLKVFKSDEDEKQKDLEPAEEEDFYQKEEIEKETEVKVLKYDKDGRQGQQLDVESVGE